MSTKVHCYLRTLRLEWRLTQREVAALLPKGTRNRVSRVERGLVPPSAGDILAYALIFGLAGQAVFPALYAETEDAVMRAAYQLHQRLEPVRSPGAERKRELIDQMFARATGKANPTKV
jgi:transcriptional regulator with XRE-family HTH domain